AGVLSRVEAQVLLLPGGVTCRRPWQRVGAHAQVHEDHRLAWLAGGPSAVPITASLRHVRGSPALGLLRRLRPPYQTSLDLAACRASNPAFISGFSCSEEGTRGAVGGRLCPWLRGSTTPSELGRRRAHGGRTQPSAQHGRALAACSPLRASCLSVQRFP